MKITRVLYWLFALFIVYLIFEILRKIFGGSLGFDELATALLVANLGFSMALHTRTAKIQAQLSDHVGWHKGKANRH